MNFLDLIWMIPLFPAVGFVINGLFGKRMPKSAVGIIACGRRSDLLHLCRRRRVSAARSFPSMNARTRVKVYEWINAGPAHDDERGSRRALPSTGDSCSIRCRR